MKKQILSIGLLALLVLSLASCASEQDVNELKSRFEDYTFDSDIAVILDASTFYFADHTLRLDDICENEELNNGYLFLDGKLYFTTAKKEGAFAYSLLVYVCDLHGNQKHLVFEKHGYKTKPWAVGNRDTMFIEHYTANALDDSSRVIDSYNVVTGVYQTEGSGKDENLSDYQKNKHGDYSCSSEDGVYSVVNHQGNITYTIDAVSLVRSEFAKELNGFDLTPGGFFATDDGKMYLLYRIAVDGMQYPYLVCEYLPDDNTIKYKFLYFADDIENFDIDHL